MFKKDFDVLKLQENYYKILQSFEFNENVSILEIKSFLEELEIFWRENIKKILLFLDKRPCNNCVLIVCYGHTPSRVGVSLFDYYFIFIFFIFYISI